MAALSDAELVNFSTIARDCGVSSPTVKGYFEILKDTLLGRWVPAYTRRPKRRVIGAPKFYFADVGVVNHLARRGPLTRGGELYGKAFENWVGHELHAHNAYSEAHATLSHWRLAGGTEVDFIVNDMEIAIEAKAASRITADHLRGLRALIEDHPRVKQRVVICLEPRARRTDDGILILPAGDFTRKLGAGDFFCRRPCAMRIAPPRISSRRSRPFPNAPGMRVRRPGRSGGDLAPVPARSGLLVRGRRGDRDRRCRGRRGGLEQLGH